MKKLKEIAIFLTIVGVMIPSLICLIYWSAAAIKVGHFPTYVTDQDWSPFRNFHWLIQYSIVTMVFSSLGIVIILILSSLQILLTSSKKLLFSNKELIVGGISIAISWYLLFGNFGEWFFD
jgi:hypothetical protein